MDDKLDACTVEREKLEDQLNMEVMPCFRVPPVMPRTALISGHCHVEFDVSAEGRPINILLTGCTEEKFAKPTRDSVRQWLYLPEIKDGNPVVARNKESKITFILRDQHKNLFPEPEQYQQDSHEHSIANEKASE